MRKEYDFSQGRKNPYAKKLKQKTAINHDNETHRTETKKEAEGKIV